MASVPKKSELQFFFYHFILTFWKTCWKSRTRARSIEIQIFGPKVQSWVNLTRLKWDQVKPDILVFSQVIIYFFNEIIFFFLCSSYGKFFFLVKSFFSSYVHHTGNRNLFRGTTERLSAGFSSTEKLFYIKIYHLGWYIQTKKSNIRFSSTYFNVHTVTQQLHILQILVSLGSSNIPGRTHLGANWHQSINVDPQISPNLFKKTNCSIVNISSQ